MGYVSAFCRTAPSWIVGLESEKGEGRPCARGSETVKGNRGRERKKWWGFSARAAAPRFFSPGTEKGGLCAPYVGGERACAGCATTCVGLRPSNAWRTLVHAYVHASVHACVPCPQLPLLVLVASAVEDYTKDKVILVI